MASGKKMKTNEQKARVRMNTKRNKERAWNKHFKNHPNDKQAPDLIIKKRDGMK